MAFVTFSAWAAVVGQLKQGRLIMRRALKKTRQRAMASAFDVWAEAVGQLRQRRRRLQSCLTRVSQRMVGGY
jgi:uncharacterized protein YlxP (DUF503 family)